MDVKAMADQMIAAVKGYVERALGPINTRLAAVETRTGALSMIAARGQSAESIAAFEALEARIKALELAVKNRHDSR
jgi:hypothetical protein